MTEYELCVNLWYCFDKTTGFINAVAGRGYYLRGTDAQKTSALNALAAADFLCVLWQPLPDRYQLTLVNFEKNEQVAFSGVIHARDIDALGMGPFEDVFKQIENVRQAYLPIKSAKVIKVPDEPLFVLTPVEFCKDQGIRPVL